MVAISGNKSENPSNLISKCFFSEFKALLQKIYDKSGVFNI